MYSALQYNVLKVQKEKGQILLTSKIIEKPGGQYLASDLLPSFDTYLTANRKTEKPVLHISLNPDPKDAVNDEMLKEIAEVYMEKMGYAQQPFIVFKHSDIERSHIHIVSVCVDEEGRKISDKFEKRRSMNICRDIETLYGLMPAADKEKNRAENFFTPLDYQKGDIKSQIASVIRHLPKYYQFQTLGEYNALLSLFNIAAEKIEGEHYGKKFQGLIYMPLNAKGERAGHPYKASLFGKSAGLPFLEMHFAKSNVVLKDTASKTAVKDAVTIAVNSTHNEKDFKKQLAQKGINVVVRRNDTGRIYGMTFIDHSSKAVWNGSRLGSLFAANSFNEYWKNGNGPILKQADKMKPVTIKDTSSKTLPAEKPHELFDFLDIESAAPHADKFGIIEAVGILIPEMYIMDNQEEKFAEQMKKKRRKSK